MKRGWDFYRNVLETFVVFMMLSEYFFQIYLAFSQSQRMNSISFSLRIKLKIISSRCCSAFLYNLLNDDGSIIEFMVEKANGAMSHLLQAPMKFFL
jgi:hypothetical protein